MKKILMVLSIVAVLASFSMVRAGTTSCSASASCVNECDTVTLSISGDDKCKCGCTGQSVHCTAIVDNTGDPGLPPGATSSYSITQDSRKLKDCTQQGGGEGGGSGPGENSNDLGWCTGCYDSNGNLTSLGEFFANAG